MGKYFLVAKPNPHCPQGRFVREFNEGFELQEKIEGGGKCKFVGTNLIIPFDTLKPFVIPVNLRKQFVYEDGRAYAKTTEYYHRGLQSIVRPKPKEFKGE